MRGRGEVFCNILLQKSAIFLCRILQQFSPYFCSSFLHIAAAIFEDFRSSFLHIFTAIFCSFLTWLLQFFAYCCSQFWRFLHDYLGFLLQKSAIVLCRILQQFSPYFCSNFLHIAAAIFDDFRSSFLQIFTAFFCSFLHDFCSRTLEIFAAFLLLISTTKFCTLCVVTLRVNYTLSLGITM